MTTTSPPAAMSPMPAGSAKTMPLPPLPPALQSRMAPVLTPMARLYPAMVQQNHTLAETFFRRGERTEAARRWRWVLSMRPTHLQALIGLAWLWIEDGRMKDAIQLLRRALALHPKHAEGRWLLARATGCDPRAGDLPPTMPLRLLEARYESNAPYYDVVQIVDHGYRPHAELTQLLMRQFQPVGVRMRLLDLGCGTGLVGESIWPLRPYLEGVDLVSAMLREARARVRLTPQQREARQALENAQEAQPEGVARRPLPRIRPVYDALWNEDARDFLLQPRGNAFDAILAADLFCEIGGLTPVFDGAVRTLSPGGYIAFSSDLGPEDGYAPQGPEVRFSHSQRYLDELAASVGLEVLSHHTAPRTRNTLARYSLLRKRP